MSIWTQGLQDTDMSHEVYNVCVIQMPVTLGSSHAQKPRTFRWLCVGMFDICQNSTMWCFNLCLFQVAPCYPYTVVSARVSCSWDPRVLSSAPIAESHPAKSDNVSQLRRRNTNAKKSQGNTTRTWSQFFGTSTTSVTAAYYVYWRIFTEARQCQISGYFEDLMPLEVGFKIIFGFTSVQRSIQFPHSNTNQT